MTTTPTFDNPDTPPATDTATTTTDTTSSATTPAETTAVVTPDVAPAPASLAAGGIVTYTTNAPWGEFTQIGRVVAVGTPEGADGPQAQIEWISVTGPMDISVLDVFVPEV